MADPLSMLGAVIETVKKLRDLSAKVKNVEVRTLIADLQLSLADLKSELANERVERMRVEEELRTTKQQSERKSKMEIRDDGSHWFVEKPTDKPQGPYCGNCLRSGHFSLMKSGGDWELISGEKWICPVCGKS